MVFVLSAWWFRNDRLVDVAIPFLGIAFVVAVLDGFRTGAMQGRWGEEYDRRTDPGIFWLCVLVYSVLGAALLVVSLVRLMDTLSR